jgi:hypothetical protein
VTDVILGLLAVLGAGALLLRLFGALFGLGLTAVEASAAASLAEASARRGDVTGMLERREASQALRRRRIRSAAWVALWLGLLVVPVVAGVARLAYAAAALLWLQPGRGRMAVTIRAGGKWRSPGGPG